MGVTNDFQCRASLNEEFGVSGCSNAPGSRCPIDNLSPVRSTTQRTELADIILNSSRLRFLCYQDMTANKYSIVIPTYNERKNLPILCWLIEKTFRAM